MAGIKRRTDWYAPFLPLLALAVIYSVVTGEWWIAGSLLAVPVFISLTAPINRYYGQETPGDRLILALEHLVALGLLVCSLVWAPRILATSWVAFALWIMVVVSLSAYFVRAALAWRRYHQGAAG